MSGLQAVRPGGAPARFVALDSLRGIAACGVLFMHIGAMGAIGTLPLIRHGDLFVDFFFVLSGFVIAAAYGARIAGGFSRGTFMLLRFGRVYPLHIAVIAAFAAVKLASGRSLFEGEHGIEYLARAVFLLEGYFHDANFYNGASWSVAVEVVAYALAALLFGRGRSAAAIAGVIWLGSVTAFVAGFEWLAFTVFLQRCLIGFGLGCLAWWIHARAHRLAGHHVSSVAEAAVLAACGWAMAVLGGDGINLLVCDLLFLVAVLIFAREGGFVSALLATAPFQALGRWSYSIYMTQMFVIRVGAGVLLAFLAWLGRDDLIGPVGQGGFDRINLGLAGDTALSLAVAAACIALSALTYRFIEQPGREWARRVARKRGAAGAEAVAPTI